MSETNSSDLKPDVREWLDRQCNRLVNGTCWTGRCFRRGGYNRPDVSQTYEMAMEIPTCEALEIYRALNFPKIIHPNSDKVRE